MTVGISMNVSLEVGIFQEPSLFSMERKRGSLFTFRVDVPKDSPDFSGQWWGGFLQEVAPILGCFSSENPFIGVMLLGDTFCPLTVISG